MKTYAERWVIDPKDELRWHVVGRDATGEVLFYARTAEIVVRSLRSVGGKRPGRKMTRKKNRLARKFGHSTFADMVLKSLARAES